MSPIQMMLLGTGAVAKKTYVDDIFSTFLYKGNKPSTQSINNGIDLSTEGGLVWIKSRTNTYNHILQDTVIGTGKFMKSNSYEGTTNTSQYITSFNTNGFSLGTDNDINNSSQDFSSWSFRKAPGFFDVVSWTGNDNGSRQISHDLGSQPGLIILKNRSRNGTNWMVWHKDFGATEFLELNASSAKSNDSTLFGGSSSTSPTSTNFTIGGGESANKNGDNFIAYLWAGGESEAATARSVAFDGSNDQLTVPASSDYAFGSGDFTVEGWMYGDNINSIGGVVGNWDHSNNQRSWLFRTESNNLAFYISTDGSSNTKIEAGLEQKQWIHFAGVRTGNTLKLFINGTEKASTTISGSLFGGDTDPIYIGSQQPSLLYYEGKISNIRVTKGQAIYTSSFKVPTEPLTTTSQGATASNVKLLCCNNSSVTGATVSSGTLTNNGATASTDSPFDDPAAFTFGESGSEPVIKCGTYLSNASSTGPEINLGFEPQWVLLKDIDDSGGQHWQTYDSMRGIATGGNDEYLLPNLNLAANASSDRIDLTPTGFKIKTNGGGINEGSNKVIYMAIRRPDPLVQKPAAAGTDVFNLVMGTSNSDVPTFVSGFVTDFALQRVPVYTMDWWTQSRLTGDKYVTTNSTNAGGTDTNNKWEYNNGWYSSTGNKSANQSWMWKRHAGFDVVTYEGNGTAGHEIPHSLNKTVEMIWVKRRDNSGDWKVGHHGLNGGTNPWHHHIELDKEYAETDTDGSWNDTAPTSTAFTLGSLNQVNNSSGDYIALLFASVDGISKCGFYTGNSGTQTITVGFQPRFLIIKKTSAGQDRSWYVLDTTQGWGSGNDTFLELNKSDPESSTDLGAPTSTGFTLTNTDGTNGSGNNYIYYCHS